MAGAVRSTGCTAGANRVDATGPTVSYDVDNQLEYEQAAERADDYCSDRYGGDARIVGSTPDYYGGDETVTFECVPD
jgi:hypothetical protein